MAFLLEGTIYAQASERSSNLDLLGYPSTVVTGWLTDFISGVLSPQPSIGITQTFPGYSIGAFFEDFYFRIHITPDRINIGNLLSSQTREFEVWNSHLNSRLLSSIGGSGTQGLTLIEPAPAPTTFFPLESRIYSLQIPIEGSPIVDAQYTYNFPAEPSSLSVIGQRVVVWPFKVNWNRNPIERLEWLTDVITKYSGKEQRRRLRTTPRRRFTYRYIFSDDDLRTAHNTLHGWQARVFAVPFYPEKTNLTGVATAGTNTIPIDTIGRGFQVGGLAVIKQSNRVFEPVEIAQVQPTQITTALPLSNTWQQGTDVIPGNFARLRPNQSTKNFLANLGAAIFQWDCVDKYDFEAIDLGDIYRGYSVLPFSPNWRDARDVVSERKVRILDNQISEPVVEDESGLPTVTRAADYVFDGLPNIAEFRSWIFHKQGRLRPFWVPSGQVDLVLFQDIGSAATNIITVESGYSLYGFATNRRDIRLELNDGTVFYRRIDSASDNNDGSETLSIDSSFGVNITVGEVNKISFLSLSRLAGDAVEFRWHNKDVSTVSQRYKSFNHDV